MFVPSRGLANPSLSEVHNGNGSFFSHNSSIAKRRFNPFFHPRPGRRFPQAGRRNPRKSRPCASEINAIFRVVGTLTVGHDSTTSATVTPSATELLALVLGKLNTATRESILRELPDDFAAAGGKMPDLEPSLVEAAGELCKALRQKVDQPRRGAVGGNLAIVPVADEPAELRIAG